MSFERRQFFRIKYPPKFRPEVIIDGKIHTLIDVSEYGLKLDYSNASKMPSGDSEFVATLGFRTGTRVTVIGKVARIDPPFVMIKLEKGIPRDVLKEEADLLLKEFGEVPTDRY